ncbi:nicotinate-nicotinamide nucleotide adenylyltransferase [Vibrio sp. DW001]|uniref:nicotinate-nicotinamide nucleotide adenylyltransferase n=1 Tax=Vibrio sp. DW001 TaxID=2912315 RepID=UPI0023B16675|nr:nicotinate-nicotinamide nucleotide adenylyltransferase [Vibrio sp. DW001]WED29114.1 nicotinate-nicotinamide nucleotide adenylyltransferase [Vibrio sp. DW001]
MSLKIENKTKIAVFGSAFNPPSLGHKSVIDSLGHFDKVILVPSISHAWGKEMLDYELRCQLVELFAKDLSSKKIEVSKVEKDLYEPEQSVTTFAVLSALEKHYTNAEFTFVMGPDNFINFDKFFNYKGILARWSVTVCPEKLNIRSSFIRDNLRNKKSVNKLTTSSVEKYLSENNVY